MSSGFGSRGSWTGRSSVVTGLYFCLVLHFYRKCVAPIKIFCNLWKWPRGSCKTCCSVETVYRLLCCALEPFSSRGAALPASAWAPPPLANVTWQRARRGGEGIVKSKGVGELGYGFRGKHIRYVRRVCCGTWRERTLNLWQVTIYYRRTATNAAVKLFATNEFPVNAVTEIS